MLCFCFFNEGGTKILLLSAERRISVFPTVNAKKIQVDRGILPYSFGWENQRRTFSLTSTQKGGYWGKSSVVCVKYFNGSVCCVMDASTQRGWRGQGWRGRKLRGLTGTPCGKTKHRAPHPLGRVECKSLRLPPPPRTGSHLKIHFTAE